MSLAGKYPTISHPILTPELEELRIEAIADLHIGVRAFEEKAFRAKLDAIRESPNTLVVLDGDIINNSIKSSVGDVYEEIMTPDEQVDYAIDLLSPIKDRIIAVCRGNHEYRSIKDVCLDPVKYICRGLGIQGSYFRDAVFFELAFGRKANKKRVTYSAYMSHGNGGGSTAGGKVNALSKAGFVAFSDVVIGAHTHMPATFKQPMLMQDPHNKNLVPVERVYVNTGTYLGMEDYAIRKNLPPSAIGNPTIILSGRKKKVRVLT